MMIYKGVLTLQDDTSEQPPSKKVASKLPLNF